MSAALPVDLFDRVRGRLLTEAAGEGFRAAGADGGPTAARVAAALRAEGRVLGDTEVLALAERLRSDMLGAGPLQALLMLDGVTDVLVNGPSAVWVDRGQGLEPADVRFPDEAAVRRLAQRLASAAGRRLDDAAPYVDVRLADGCRLHAVLPPLAVGGTVISLRIPSRRALTVEDLLASGSLAAPLGPWLRAVVTSRCPFLVTGGTGTGKTTLLATLLGLVDPRHRIVIVEDSTELSPDHPHVVRLEARRSNVEGAGGVDLCDLVRQSLRMRPDRLVVGEVRGPEVVDLLAALNTGHEGGCGTVHANAPEDLPARIEALASGAGLARDAVHSQLAAALRVVIHLDRRDGARRVAGIWVLERGPDGLVGAVPAVDRRGDPGPGAELLRRLVGRSGRRSPGHLPAVGPPPGGGPLGDPPPVRAPRHAAAPRPDVVAPPLYAAMPPPDATAGAPDAVALSSRGDAPVVGAVPPLVGAGAGRGVPRDEWGRQPS